MTHRIRPPRALLLLWMLLAALAAPAGAIQVSGDVTGRWTADHSPIHVVADSRVPAGETLVIDPDVQVMLAPGVSLFIEGYLTAIGSTDGPVRFERANPAAPWRTIAVRSSGQALFVRCQVRGGGSSGVSEVTGAIRVDGGQLDLMSCEVSGSASSGVLVNGGAFTAATCSFDRNGGAQPIDAGIHVVTGFVSLATGPYGNSITNSIFGLYNQDIMPVVASSIWWGSATGPQHVSNVRGHGVSVSDDVLFTGYATVNPYPTMGDLDRDGHITVHDLSRLLRIAGGIERADSFSLEVGDTIRDGVINLRDVQAFAPLAISF